MLRTGLLFIASLLSAGIVGAQQQFISLHQFSRYLNASYQADGSAVTAGPYTGIKQMYDPTGNRGGTLVDAAGRPVTDGVPACVLGVPAFSGHNLAITSTGNLPAEVTTQDATKSTTITFSGLLSGQTLTVGDLVLTATSGDLTAAQVAEAFDGDGGNNVPAAVLSGGANGLAVNPTGYTAGAITSGARVVFSAACSSSPVQSEAWLRGRPITQNSSFIFQPGQRVPACMRRCLKAPSMQQLPGWGSLQLEPLHFL